MKSASVAILGGGVVGLTTGIRLLEAGFKNLTLYAQRLPPSLPPSPPLVSEVACALWLPICTSQQDCDDKNYIVRESVWARYSFARFAAIKGDCGISTIAHHEYYSEQEADIGLLISPEMAAFLPNFSEGFETNAPALPNTMGPLTYRQSFTTFIIAMPRYLAWLRARFVAMGGKIASDITFQHVDQIAPLGADVYVNALGLGAAALFSDPGLIGVKGQLVLCPPNPHIVSSIGAGEFCMIPRPDALILGSLFERNFIDEKPSPSDTQLILEVVGSWVKSPQFRDSDKSLPATISRELEVRSVLAGIRPFRTSGVRLEYESIGGLNVVHNYGHGGGGVSISWGCAESVLAILREL